MTVDTKKFYGIDRMFMKLRMEIMIGYFIGAERRRIEFEQFAQICDLRKIFEEENFDFSNAQGVYFISDMILILDNDDQFLRGG